MDNRQPTAPSQGLSLSQSSYGSRAAANSYIHGDGSGNSASNNAINSGNFTFNFNRGDPNSSQNHAEILQCLYTSVYESHRGRVRAAAEGTCTWVTEHPKYKDWLEKRTSGPLWLSADPGCGKSVIASFLIEHLGARKDSIVCYFFFKDDSEEQRSATFALCAILHQLFGQRTALCKYAERALEAKGKTFTREVDALWDILVKAAAEGGCGDIICVLDALDECEEVTLAPLIRHITHLRGSQTIPLKFLVTSRPYHKIETGLGSAATTIRLKGEDEVNAITTDVTRVIDSGIKELELVWRNPGGLEYLRNLLRLSADRTFLWVSLVLEILKNSEDGSREEFTRIVATAPRDLAEFYTKILDKSTKPDKARRILHIVVAAARPLTLVEMSLALTIWLDGSSAGSFSGDLHPGFEMTVKNLCGLFVRIIDSKVYLVHQTAREFLIKRSSLGQGSWQYSLCYGVSNYIFADICISYLSLEDFENDPLVLGPHASQRDELSQYKEKYPFLDYAARHWAGHFQDSRDGQVALFERTGLICKRGSNRFLTWLNVYWGNSDPYNPFPNDFTHLMIASWLGQRMVVERLLKEGGDFDARSKMYGTALNVAARRGDVGITRVLVERNVKVYLCGKEYNISHVWRPSRIERVVYS